MDEHTAWHVHPEQGHAIITSCARRQTDRACRQRRDSAPRRLCCCRRSSTAPPARVAGLCAGQWACTQPGARIPPTARPGPARLNGDRLTTHTRSRRAICAPQWSSAGSVSAQDGVRRRIEQSRAGKDTCSPFRTSRAEDGATNRRSGNALLETIRFGLREASARCRCADAPMACGERWVEGGKRNIPRESIVAYTRRPLIHTRATAHTARAIRLRDRQHV